MIQTVPAAQPAPVLAADLGGTKISAGLVDGAGRVHARRTVPTGAMAGPVAVVATLVEVLTVVREDAAAQALAPAAVGIGTAGVVDSGTGRIVSATDAIPGWAGTELGTSVAAALDLPTRVLNDVHAHALGEDTFGAGAGASSLLLVAVGTGIGGALVQGGAVLTGTQIGRASCRERVEMAAVARRMETSRVVF